MGWSKKLCDPWTREIAPPVSSMRTVGRRAMIATKGRAWRETEHLQGKSDSRLREGARLGSEARCQVPLSVFLVAVKSQRADTLKLHVSRPCSVKLVATCLLHFLCSCLLLRCEGIQPHPRLAVAANNRGRSSARTKAPSAIRLQSGGAPAPPHGSSCIRA